jgi:uncharacterized OsmC-like protein
MVKAMYKPLIVSLLLVLALPFSIAWGRDASVQKQATQTEETPPQLTTAAVTATLALPGRSIVNARNNHWVIDSPGALGGPNQAMNPLDAFLGALSTCGMFVYETAAKELGIPLDHISVVAQGDFAPQGLRDGSVNPRIRAFRVLIMMTGPDKTQAEQLRQNFQTRCPIYTTLSLAAPVDIIHVGMDDITGVVLDVEFTYNLDTADEYIAAVSPMAEQWTAVPGLMWKLWKLNPETKRAGAVYVFESAEARQAYLDSDLAAAVANHPALSDFQVNQYSILAAETQATRGPATAMAASKRTGSEETGEAGALLRINFNYNVSASDLITAVSPLAPDFAAVEGLRWKIWALDEENSSFSGLLYFDTVEMMQTFLESDLAATVMGHSALSDFEVASYQIMETESEVTRAPIR